MMMLGRSLRAVALVWLVLGAAACRTSHPNGRLFADLPEDHAATVAIDAPNTIPREPAMQVHFLEIVTPDVDAICATYAETHGVTFSEPVPEFGNARTAPLSDGGMMSVRAPMHSAEEPIVRAYLLVDDIQAATAAAEASGALIAHSPLELPGYGTFAIFIHGGVHHGLWQR